MIEIKIIPLGTMYKITGGGYKIKWATNKHAKLGNKITIDMIR
ncbi:MAG: hypothetical protein RLZ33_2953 [Bacteroidota bacterium]|jgi:hypothetical protein